MKKILFVIIICLLFVNLSFVSAKSVIKLSNASEDSPSWAVGNFTGQWGLNFWGHDWIPIGPVNGYYGIGFLNNRLKFGRFLIEFEESDAENKTTFQGLFISVYLLGKATSTKTGNTTAFVGLGGYNETHFRWRIMGLEGPTLFMNGTFNEFE
jgi:hypothetical protein